MASLTNEQRAVWLPFIDKYDKEIARKKEKLPFWREVWGIEPFGWHISGR
jgi:hypothetical protein